MEPNRVRKHSFRVAVHGEEKEIILKKVKEAGLTIGSYFRQLSFNSVLYSCVDYDKVNELARMNGDLGRLGGLFKLYLSRNSLPPTEMKTLKELLEQIKCLQNQMATIMMQIINLHKGRNLQNQR
jgi:hypothetical protein